MQCSQCIPGVAYRYPFPPSGGCKSCPSVPQGVLTGYLTACAAAAAAVFAAQHAGVATVSLSLSLEFLQLLSLLGLIDVGWPSRFHSLVFPGASLAVGNVEVGALGCLVLESGWWGRWVLALLLPAAAATTLFALHHLTTFVAAWRLRHIRRDAVSAGAHCPVEPLTR